MEDQIIEQVEDQDVLDTAECTPEEESTQKTEENADKEPEETPADRNWREMREMMKELKEQNKALEQQLQYKDQMSQQQPAPEPEDTYTFDDDELLTAAQAKKLAQQMVKKELQDYQKQQETQNIPQKLSQQYPDYNEVVNQENVQKLITDDPETAQDIEALKADPMRMSRLLYKTLKTKYGITKEEEEMPKPQKTKTENRPPSSSSAVPKRSALAEANAFANGLTPELRKQLWEEMSEAEKYQ
ncbi:MAG: hypothetical protein PVF17_00400 [Ignavibacteria bacterium]|jgi:hypothetical protein